MTISSQKSSRLSALLLMALLVLLAFRLTASETLRDALTQKSNALAAQVAPTPDSPVPIPVIGPTFTAAYATLTLFLSAGACFVAANTPALSRRRLAQLAFIALILALLLASTFHAANRFNALIGTADLAASLLAAWTIALLCHDALLGVRARLAVVAAIIAILVMGSGRALLQYFVEYPDLAQYIQEHKDEALRAQGIVGDSAEAKLFLSRVDSREVTGFGALSNVFATEMIALVALLTALLAAAAPLLITSTPSGQNTSSSTDTSPPPEPARAKPPTRKKRTLDYQSPNIPLSHGPEIPIHLVAYIASALLLIIAFVVLAFTGSKGGIAAALLAAAILTLAALFHNHLLAWRKPLLALAALATIALPAALLSYGITHHGLPSKSLLFRWHYWVGSLPMIQNAPLSGVGLNNFGDYYLHYKLPSSPEDVKDPHSFFIRLAAEAGLPATLAIAALLFWMILGAIRHEPSSLETRNPKLETPLTPSLLLAAAAALAWIPLHFLAESPNDYTVILTFLFAALAWSTFAAALYLLHALPQKFLRYLTFSATLAALAMLLYDQINMALVTGPAAMLFWILLGLGDSQSTSAPLSSQSKIETQKSKIVPLLLPLTLTAAALVTLLTLTIPLATDSFPWDPAPYEFQYLRQIMANRLDLAAAPLNAALARSPNSGELVMQRIVIDRQLHHPLADDIRKILSLDRANAKIRLDLALPDSDLPTAERIDALQQALFLDQQLPPGEYKRLTPQQLQSVNETLARLKNK